MATNQYDLQGPATQNRGCFFAIFRCFNSKPVNKSTAPIEFENLVSAEKRANDIRERSQVVTELEREHVMSGNFDQLLAEQERLDRERDAELRRREEALRLEEEAYHAAKRGASRKVTTQTLTDLSNTEEGLSSGTSPRRTGNQLLTIDDPPTEEMGPWTAATTAANTEPASKASTTVTRDEDDFDKFLESVKAQQISLTTKVPDPEPTLSDSEDEIDFGFWEKATTTVTPTPSDNNNTKELNLL